MSDRTDRDARVQTIETLVRTLEATQDIGLRRTARELVQALMDLHGAGLTRMLEICDAAGPAGAPLIDAFGDDEVVKHLLLLHGLHPVELETRVRQALESTRPYLRSHGGNVELIGIDAAGAVTLKLEGSCQSCPSSSETLKNAIEEALYEAAPDITALVVEGRIEQASAPTVGFVPLASLQTQNTRQGGMPAVPGGAAVSASAAPAPVMQPLLHRGGG